MSLEKTFGENPERYHHKQTHYDVLGINPDSTIEEIKSAFRKRVQETHPDKPENIDKEEEFKKINEAHRILSDPEQRQQYDKEQLIILREEKRREDFSPKKAKTLQDIMLNYLKDKKK